MSVPMHRSTIYVPNNNKNPQRFKFMLKSSLHSIVVVVLGLLLLLHCLLGQQKKLDGRDIGIRSLISSHHN